MSSKKVIIFSTFFIILSLCSQAVAAADGCGADEDDSCINKKKALTLKIIAIVSILISSITGVSLPLVTRWIPALSPERSLFVIVKAFAAGIILATAFMHVLPDSFDLLSSDCLKENPWHNFPFTGFVAMLSAVVTLMIDSIATSICSKKHNGGVMQPESDAGSGEREMAAMEAGEGGSKFEVVGSQLLRYRVIAVVLELGIIIHSVVIGLSLGESNNTCSIRGLIAALCFHQMFEGMGLGGSILQAEYKFIKKAAMSFFFAVTTPSGIALGMALASSYQENSPHALITVGLLNASSAGLLIYMALVDLLAADFMGPKLQGSVKLQIKAFMAVLLGAGGMSVIAIWS